MDYNLAKQLKDAGLPQGERSPYCLKCKVWKTYSCFKEGHKTDFIRIPTLSELIEACGDGFRGLKRLKISGLGDVVIINKIT